MTGFKDEDWWQAYELQYFRRQELTMKKCKDCKWCRIGPLDWLIIGWKAAKCHQPKIGPQSGDMDFSTGVREPNSWWYCTTLRNHDYDPTKHCGPKGRYFEKKKNPR